MIKSKSLFQRIYDIFENWDEEAFRNHHHEDFMHLQETDFLRRLKTEADSRNDLDTRFQKWGKDQADFNNDLNKRFVDWGTKVSKYEQSTYDLNQKQDESLAQQEEPSITNETSVVLPSQSLVK